jgi:excisionase family DNA binding protein
VNRKIGAILPRASTPSGYVSGGAQSSVPAAQDQEREQADGRSYWLTPRQAAAYLGVGVDTIYEACAAADLKHVKLGYRTIRLRREWIDLWAEKHATPAE